MEIFHTKGPINKITEEDFVERLMVGGEMETLSFSRYIYWVIESETTYRYLHGGKQIGKDCTINDAFGFLSSINIEHAKLLAKGYSIDQSSTLVVQATTRVFELALFETPENARHNADKQQGEMRHYTKMPDSWLIERWFNGEQKYFQANTQKPDLACEITWSSDRSDEENEQAIQAFKARWV